MEFSVFVDVFGWAREDFQLPLEVITCGFSKTVTSTFNIPLSVDQTIEMINVDDYDALAIPGGFAEYGFYEEAYDERFLSLIRRFEAQQKPIASICVAALALGKSGILQERKATTYHLNQGQRQQQLKKYCPKVIEQQALVIDQQVITSYCPETAPAVAFALLEMLTSNYDANQVRIAMGFEPQKSLEEII